MPPRLNLFTANKALSALRQPTPSTLRLRALQSQSSLPIQRRWNSSNDRSKKVEPQPDEQAYPTVDQLPHVSEEAHEISCIMDKEKRCDGVPSTPELDQGTPVEEILSRDKEAMKHMPKVMRDELKKNGGSRSFSTSARSRMSDMYGVESTSPGGDFIPGVSPVSGGASEPASDEATAAALASMIEQVQGRAVEENPGLKFDAPAVPEDLKTLNFRKRYDTLQDQFTKMMMESGKLTKAQKNMSIVLDHLRTSSPPQINPRRRLLGAPFASQLPLDPVLYLTVVVDSVAPLFRIRQQKGIAGGGAAVQIPQPLTLRQRRRAAIKWILDASEKRRDALFAHRVAAEVVAVAEGRSGVWEKRDTQHKIGISGRANLGATPRRK